MKMQWPDGLDETRFLSEYWQKKPLLIRNAFPDFDNPIDPNELAGLACDEDSNARYIEHTGNNEWRLCAGPLSDDFFDDVTGHEWSLLVSDVEKLLPEFRQYLQPFRFLPDWRIDDLMISYAPVGGSVGAHVDQYDVFLLQADGTREWQIESTRRDSETISVSNTIAILGDFIADEGWELNAGDMLYLPPQFAHHGIAKTEPCMTWSIGFRAPSVDEMLPEIINYLMDDPDTATRFKDPNRSVTSTPGLIDSTDIAEISRMLRATLEQSNDTLHEWIGRVVTEPKENNPGNLGTINNIDPDNLREYLDGGGSLISNSQKRTAYTLSDNKATLFADGKCYPCAKSLAQEICNNHSVAKADITDPSSIELLTILCEQQVLLLQDNTIL